MREMVCPREEHTYQLFNAQWSALKTYIQVTCIWTQQVIFRNIYVYIHICMHKNDGKRGHEFQGEQGGV